MGLEVEKTVKATWTCDWCDSTVTTDSERLPNDWVDANRGEVAGGVIFCSDAHYYLSRCAWEDGFEDAIEATSAYHEQIRRKWLDQND